MEPRPGPTRPRKRRSAGYAIGAFVVEIDQRLLRNQPPVEELVAKGDVVRGASGEPGEVKVGGLTVVIPGTDQDDAEPVVPPGSPADPGNGQRE